MNDQEYHKGGDEVRKAWFAYKAAYNRAGTSSVCSFLAGWNVALAFVQGIKTPLVEEDKPAYCCWCGHKLDENLICQQPDCGE